jgi:hypothetical protein
METTAVAAPGQSVNPGTRTRFILYVGALPYGTDTRRVEELFKRYGPILSVRINADWQNPTGEPHALVVLANPESAVREMDGKKVDNTYLRVH